MLRDIGDMTGSASATLKVCLDSLSVCSGQNTLPVYRCVGYLIRKVSASMNCSTIVFNGIFKFCRAFMNNIL